MEHLRALLRARFVPFAVEIGADGIGAQMAATRPVRIHVGNDVEGRLLAEAARDGVVVVEQLLECAFHPPFGHRLTGMLAGVGPEGKFALADAELVEPLYVDRLAWRTVLDTGDRKSAGEGK